MRLVIPDDWDGVTWRSVCIQFPESDLWLALLNGMLSQWRRGRLWDESTGSVLDAIAIGQEIWERSADLPTCDGTPTPPEIIEIIRRVGCEVYPDEGDEDNMGSCNGPQPPVKIEDGHLWYWWCCEWLDLGALPGAAAEDVVDPWEDLDPAPTYSACSKAKAIVDVIYLVADTVWENQGAAPWQYVGLIEDVIPGHNDLDDNQIISAFLAAIALNAVYDYADVFDVNDKQQLLCGVVRLLDDTAAGITRTQWDQMIGVINTVYGEGISDFFRNCADAIGPSDMREITALNSIEAGYDCSCPDPAQYDPTTEWETDWSHYWNFLLDDYVWLPGAVTAYIAGQGFVDWADPSTGYVKTEIEADMNGESATLTKIWVKVHVGTGFNWSGETFKLETDEGNIQTLNFGGDPVVAGGDLIYEDDWSHNVDSDDHTFLFHMEGHVDGVSGETDPDSPRVIAFAIGGTGTDPFA